ncbi:hypothetical protein AMC82_CH02719 [Rhizobium phaseoli]|nr:hypothetical protein AMC84_CH02731 [Rhizobium phaseoli]ANL79166.1 hypothetical protein AMC82_CH02719 [Rhizobium phaseoli]
MPDSFGATPLPLERLKLFFCRTAEAILGRLVLRYHLIPAQPTPPPSIGKADVMRGYLTPNRLFEHLA